MDVPLHIAFHNLQPSSALESYIRRRVAKLQRMYSRLISCRVSVEALHNQHRTGNITQVHIEMHVPQGDLIVSHEPNRVKERYAKRDIHMSVRHAFRTAEQQLKEYKDRQTEEDKRRDNGRDVLIGGDPEARAPRPGELADAGPR